MSYNQEPMPWETATTDEIPPSPVTGTRSWEPPKRGLPAWAALSMIAGGLLALLLIAVVSDPTPSTPTPVAIATTNEPTASSKPAVERAEPSAVKPAPVKPSPINRMGRAVRVGDFEYTVHAKKCGISRVGSQYLSHKAQGSFCRLDVTVKNVTRSAHYFHADGTVVAKDSTGRKFSADSEAGIYGNADGAGFLDEINPGNRVRAFIYFDVPSGTSLTSVIFDAGLFTTAGDVTVVL